MDEIAQQEDERENLSGYDDYEAWRHAQSMRHETLGDMDNSKDKEDDHGN